MNIKNSDSESEIKFIKCLAIKQPAASLIVDKNLMNNLVSQKNIENRKKSLFNSSKWKPFNILIFSSKKRMTNTKTYRIFKDELVKNYFKTIDKKLMPTSVIIGAAKIIQMPKIEDLPEKFKNNIWANGPFCMILDDIVKLPEPIKYKGMLSLFKVPISILGKRNLQFLKDNNKPLESFIKKKI